MKKLFYILLFAGFIALWASQQARLNAYDACYMAHYEDWNGATCELGR